MEPEKKVRLDSDGFAIPKPIRFGKENLSYEQEQIKIKLQLFYKCKFPFEDLLEFWARSGSDEDVSSISMPRKFQTTFPIHLLKATSEKNEKEFNPSEISMVSKVTLRECNPLFREFAMNAVKGTFRRYLSFKDANDMKDFFVRHVPLRFDIGPVYNYRPSRLLPDTERYPLKREFVIDIDVKDYKSDNAIICCETLCQHCWRLMVGGARFIIKYLRDIVGAKKITCVFSGKKGLHITVHDEELAILSNEQRRVLSAPLLYVQNMTPMFFSTITTEQHGILNELLTTRLRNENLFKHEKIRDQCVRMISDYLVSTKWREMGKELFDPQREIELAFSSPTDLDNNTVEKTKSEIWWSNLIDLVIDAGNNMIADKAPQDFNALINSMDRVRLFLTFPRIDRQVSFQLNHLLKSVFSFHASTLKWSVPIHIDQLETFDPDRVPTIHDIYGMMQGRRTDQLNQLIQQYLMNLYSGWEL